MINTLNKYKILFRAILFVSLSGCATLTQKHLQNPYTARCNQLGIVGDLGLEHVITLDNENSSLILPNRFQERVWQHGFTYEEIEIPDFYNRSHYEKNPMEFVSIWNQKAGKTNFVEKQFLTQIPKIDSWEKARYFEALYKAICSSPTKTEELPDNLLNEIGIVKESFAEEQKQWIKTNKNSVKDILEYNDKVRDRRSEQISHEALNKLLDNKVRGYLSKKYPFTKPYLDFNIVSIDGTKAKESFYKLFRALILGRNPNTGFKVELKISSEADKIVWDIENNGEGMIFYFNPFKQSMVVQKVLSRKGLLTSNLDMESSNLAIKQIFPVYWSIPQDSHLDLDFIESIK
ncbi:MULTISPECIES: hypothetical protein [unclassified Leptospira]|uniref:hypothetical protein n=1 Tax=unclassified Leptospira TaxID=2633828 RepID=UPI0002BD7097|nr:MULTISPECIES: hypothetical protein [unclassified Leptospira]EMK01245.1 hypothetical protein LEP1GSC192_1167 [Leptospira sp. B5-022]MCR1795459.1 hypothetical protein [Leptospira sp. id769339]